MNLMDVNFRLFDQRIRERGLSYFQGGHVHELKYQDLHATATVMGEKIYKVDIAFNKSGKIKNAYCTCPYAYNGYCKHVAATIYEIDYQKSEGFLEDESSGDDEMLSDAEKFCKDCYNESYRIGYKEVPSFYERKEKEILSRQEKWSEKDLIDNISYLYTLRLPMAVGQNSYSRYLSFMKGKNYPMKVKKETFSYIFSRYPYFPFMREALADEEFREVVNLLLSQNISSSGDIRDAVIYNIEEAGPYLSESNLMGLLTKTGPYDLDKEKLLNVFIDRDYEKGIEELSSSRYLTGESLYTLALYYEKKGDKEKAKSFYKKMLGKSRDLPFDFFASYWRSLSEEEKISEYPSLHEAARNSRHDKAFAILVGSGKKSDLRGLAIDEFMNLDDEVKKQFPEEYLSVLLSKVEKKLVVNNYTQLTFIDCLPLFEKYPLVLSSLVRKKNDALLRWLGDLGKREKIIVLLRDYGLLKEMHIHPYEEAD